MRVARKPTDVSEKRTTRLPLRRVSAQACWRKQSVQPERSEISSSSGVVGRMGSHGFATSRANSKSSIEQNAPFFKSGTSWYTHFAESTSHGRCYPRGPA